MKTNNIPAFVTLLAGGVYCILAFEKNVENMEFLKQLLIVLLIFYIIGSVIKMILDFGISFMADPVPEAEVDEEEEDGEAGEDEQQDELENIDSADTKE